MPTFESDLEDLKAEALFERAKRAIRARLSYVEYHRMEQPKRKKDPRTKLWLPLEVVPVVDRETYYDLQDAYALLTINKLYSGECHA